MRLPNLFVWGRELENPQGCSNEPKEKPKEPYKVSLKAKKQAKIKKRHTRNKKRIFFFTDNCDIIKMSKKCKRNYSKSGRRNTK